MSVTADNNGFGPARHQPRDITEDNGFTEHGSIEDITDSSVWRLPHLLQLEFCHWE